MTKLSSRLPALNEWRKEDGRGRIDPSTWIWITGKSDEALGYCAMLWPNFVELDDHVLRAPVDLDRFRRWERGTHSRAEIECAMNMFSVEGVFQTDPEQGELYSQRVNALAALMADMWDAKLRRQFPDRRISVFVVDNDDDCGITFHQA